MIKGTTVTLIKKTLDSYDEFGAPIYTEEEIEVNDVLVGQPTSEDIITTNELHGKHIAYVLGIPKGDENIWEDTDVIIWGKRYRTIGKPQTGIQENIPLRWKANIQVEHYG